MNRDLENKILNEGELRLEDIKKDETDNDKKFRASVKNILILIKDFYGADTAAFYWYNLLKKQNKLLTSSETEDEKIYRLRYDIGDDVISQACSKKEPSIVKSGCENDRIRFAYRTEISDIKSVLVFPVLIDKDSVGCIVCESKADDFFAPPNIKTLSVFAESIANYIMYYSYYEEFYYQDIVLSSVASGRLNNTADVIRLIETITLKFIEYTRLYIVFASGSEYRVLDNLEDGSGSVIDINCLALQSINNKKFTVFNLKKGSSDKYRFYRDEKIEEDSIFIVLPAHAGNKCLGALCIDMKDNLILNQQIINKVYKMIFPVFVFLYELLEKR